MDPTSLLCFIPPIVKCLVNRYKIAKNGYVYGICLPRRSGKTELAKSLEDTDYMLIDIEQSIKLHISAEELDKLQQLEKGGETTSYNAFYLPLVKRYVREMHRNFKKKKIIIVCSQPEVFEYLKIKRVVYLCENNKFFETVKNGMTPEVQRLVIASRDAIIRAAGEQLKAFNSWDQLQALVAEFFKLKPKL